MDLSTQAGFSRLLGARSSQTSTPLESSEASGANPSTDFHPTSPRCRAEPPRTRSLGNRFDCGAESLRLTSTGRTTKPLYAPVAPSSENREHLPGRFDPAAPNHPRFFKTLHYL